VGAPFNCVPSAASLAALLANAVVATALGFVVYFRLIRTIGSMGTASVGYLKPGVGVLIGYALMEECLTWTAGAGLIAILIGVAAVNQKDSLGALWRPGRLQPIPNGVSDRSRHKALLSGCAP
jgi:drug/metabolite transporter (DMT)-like permease